MRFEYVSPIPTPKLVPSTKLKPTSAPSSIPNLMPLLTEKIASQHSNQKRSGEKIGFFDQDEDQEKLAKTRQELETELETAKKYLHQLYDIYPATSAAARELERIAALGKSHQGLEYTDQTKVAAYFLCNSDEPFAFALGNEVYVSTRLINDCADEDTIASYPAHEIEHVAGRHLLKRKALEAELKSIQSFLKTASLGRIHEYEADSGAPFRLQQAGYDPSAYQDALKVFIPEKKSKKSRSNIDHGSLYDRLSIQHYILKAEDFTNTALGRTEKPANLTNLPESPNRFNRIATAIASNRTYVAEQLCDQVPLETLLRFAGLAWKEVEFPRQKDDYDDDDEQKPLKLADTVKLLEVFSFICQKLADRVEGLYPELSQQEQAWVNFALLIKLAGIRYNSFKYLEKKLTNHKLTTWIPKLGLASQLLNSFAAPADVYHFCQVIATVSGENIHPLENGQLLNRSIWSEFSSSIMDRSDLTEDLLKKIGPNFGLIDQEGNINLPHFAEFFNQVRLQLSHSTSSLWSIEGELHELRESACSNREHTFVEKLKQAHGDRYEDETLAVLIEHEHELLPKELDRYIECESLCQKYCADDSSRLFHGYIGKARQDILAMVHQYFSFANDEFINQRLGHYMMGYLKEVKPREFALIAAIQQGEYQQAIEDYLSDHTVAEMMSVFTFCSFALSGEGAGEKVFKYIQQHISHHIPAMCAQDRSYIKMMVAGADDLLVPSLGLDLSGQRPAAVDQVVTFRRGGEYGFSWYELQLIAQFDALKDCSNGLGFESSRQHFEELLNSIDLTQLSATGVTFVTCSVLKTITDLLERFSSRSKRSEENNSQQLWESYLAHPQVIALRSRYTQLLDGKHSSLEDRLHAAQKLIKVIGGRGSGENLLGKTVEQARFMSPVVAQLMAQIEALDIDVQSIGSLQLVHDLAPYFDDRRASTVVQSAIEVHMAKLMDFRQAVQLTEQLLADDVVNNEAFDYIQENLVNTKDQLQEFEAVWQKVKKKLSESGSSSVALAAFFDYGFEWLIEKNAIRTFEAAIMTWEDDAKLRELLAPLWFDLYCNPSPYDPERYRAAEARPYKIKLNREAGQSSFGLEGHSLHTFVPFTTFIDQIYTLLTQNEVDFILRKILYSNEGVLTTQAGRKMLYEHFMSSVVDTAQDINLTQLVTDLTRIILSVDKKNMQALNLDEVNLGESITEILRKRLFVKPPQPGSNEQAATAIATGFKGSFSLRGHSFTRAGYSPGPRSRAEKALYDQDKSSEEQELPQLSQEEAAILLDFNPFDSEEVVTDLTEFAPVTQQIKRAKDHLFSQVELATRAPLAERLGPLKVLITIAKSRGTLGERFLQLIGYYLDLPPKYQKEVDKSYDSVRGQLKYTAFRTLKREAEKETATPALKAFWSDLIELRTTGRGGSLTTVYQGLMRDGSLKAVKVMVPNPLMFIREFRQEAALILKELGSLPAYKNRVELQLAAVLVQEIASWAEQDIAAIEYEEQELAFRAAHDGTFSSSGVIEIKVPHMTPTGTGYIKIEDWVEGHTLVAAMADGETTDLVREVGQAIKENYAKQLATPIMNGKHLIHSDYHGGQFQIKLEQDKVDAEGRVQVYILDRGFWLEFSPQEAEHINFVRGEEISTPQAVRFLQLLYSLPENAGISKTKKMKISAQLAFIVGNALRLGTSAADTATLLFLELRKEKIFIPIKWTLLQKNDTYLSGW